MWVPNSANAEMRKEGYFAHSHSCNNTSDGSAYATLEEVDQIARQEVFDYD
jgi:hypothetical protein